MATDFFKAGQVTEVRCSADELCNMLLQHRSAVPSCRLLTLRGKKMTTIQSAFDEIGAAFQFPWYFGENWAAFDECLNDPDWMPALATIVIVADHSTVFSREGARVELAARLIATLQRAIGDWGSGVNGRSLGFGIVLQDAP
jgi:Barstar (barnase inhibitor)